MSNVACISCYWYNPIANWQLLHTRHLTALLIDYPFKDKKDIYLTLMYREYGGHMTYFNSIDVDLVFDFVADGPGDLTLLSAAQQDVIKL